MKFSAIFSILALAASAVSAFEPSYYDDGPVLARRSYDHHVDVDFYDAPSQYYRRAPAPYEVEAPLSRRDLEDAYLYTKHLVRRNHLDYLRNIDTRTATGSFNKGQWTRIHGDSKSSHGGKYHMETMTASNGVHHVRLIENGREAAKVTVPRPQVGCAIHQLRVHYGGPSPPPAGC